MSTSTTTLYRFYDAHDRLLYVGISERGPERWKAHRKEKPWWTDVARTTTEHYGDRQAALDAERAAIIAEQPLHNVVHNRQRKVAGSRSKGWALGPASSVELADASDRHEVIRPGDVVAVHTWSDDFPPVGLVTAVDAHGFTLRLYQWHTLHFGGARRVVVWPDVVKMMHAEVEEVIDGVSVFDMDPLADFQRQHDTREHT